MKKKKIILVIALIVVCIIASCLVISNLNKTKQEQALQYSQEYIPGQEGIQGNVDVEKYLNIHEDFAVGANSYGYAVFKEPDKAMTKLQELYSNGISLIQNEFNLEPLSDSNYNDYKIYGLQVTTGTDEEQEAAHFVGSFFDIYENSFGVN